MEESNAAWAPIQQDQENWKQFMKEDNRSEQGKDIHVHICIFNKRNIQINLIPDS